MRFSDVSAFLSDALKLQGYEPLPLFDPGPDTLVALQSLSADAIVFVLVGAGAGLTTENLFDLPYIRIRVIGVQNDYDYAEKLAQDIDTILLKVDSNTAIGNAKSLYITRTGGGPVCIDKDAADRYHFQTTYITETQTGL